MRSKVQVHWWLVAANILFAEFAGLVGAFFAGDIGGVYAGLVRPPLSPPGWIFGVVWVVLYALMGYAAYLVQENGRGATALALYLVQLGLNALWPVVFFRFQMFGLAAVLLVALDAVVLICVREFYRSSRLAGALLLPYLFWLLFATYLNFGVVVLN